MISVQGHSAQGCQGLPLQFLRFPGGEWHVTERADATSVLERVKRG